MFFLKYWSCSKPVLCHHWLKTSLACGEMGHCPQVWIGLFVKPHQSGNQKLISRNGHYPPPVFDLIWNICETIPICETATTNSATVWVWWWRCVISSAQRWYDDDGVTVGSNGLQWHMWCDYAHGQHDMMMCVASNTRHFCKSRQKVTQLIIAPIWSN